MAAASTPARNDPNARLLEVRMQTEQVKDVMRDTIQKTLQRGDALDVLDEKAVHLEEQARTFAKQARVLRWRKCWDAAKWWLLLVFVIAIIIVIALALGGVFSK